MKLTLGGDTEETLLGPKQSAGGARVDVYGTANNTCKLVITDKVHPTGYLVEFVKDNTIKVAMDMLKAVGVTAIITGGAAPR